MPPTSDDCAHFADLRQVVRKRFDCGTYAFRRCRHPGPRPIIFPDMKTQQSPPTLGATVAVAALIAGNLLGAGILGLPINTGLAGVIPAFLSMVLFGGAMFFSAVVLARESIAAQSATFNLPSLYQRYMGAGGKWIAIAANVLILYGLLTAYLTGATSILVNQLGVPGAQPLVLLVVFAVLGGLTLLNVAIIERYNTVLMVALGAAFVVLVIMAGSRMQAQRLLYTDWLYLPAAVPIVVTAFHFHNIIPTVCERLRYSERAVVITMAAGMLIGFAMNAVWVVVGVGALPLAEGNLSLRYAFVHSLPVTVPMGLALHSPYFTMAAMTFALIAIVTSFIANGVGLLGFLSDLTKNIFKVDSRALVATLALAVPLAVALLYPDIFLRAIDLVGGVGIVVLFGILPALIARRGRGVVRRLALPMVVVFSVALVFEVFQELGVTHVEPAAVQRAEYWVDNLSNHPPRADEAGTGR